jgi:hypothetical protein
VAKFAILCGSGFAGAVSFIAGRRILKIGRGAAISDAEAQASTSA